MKAMWDENRLLIESCNIVSDFVNDPSRANRRAFQYEQYSPVPRTSRSRFPLPASWELAPEGVGARNHASVIYAFGVGDAPTELPAVTADRNAGP